MYKSEDQLNRAKAISAYLYPYWAKPTTDIKSSVDCVMREKPCSCMFKGTRSQLQEVAVYILCKWGYIDWENYNSEQLLLNSFSISDKGASLSDDRAKLVIIYHPEGTQRNSYIEEAISHNFSYRDLIKRPTVILTEVELPMVEALVKKSNRDVVLLGKVAKEKVKPMPAYQNESSYNYAPSITDPFKLGNITEMQLVSRGDHKGRLKLTFLGGAVTKYTYASNKTKLTVGQPCPEGVKFL